MKHATLIILMSGIMALCGCTTEKAPVPQQQVPPTGASNPMVEQMSPAPAGAPVGGPSQMGMESQPPVDIQSVLSSLTGSGKANARVVTRG